MHPEVAELLPKLKEILYDCAVDIRATKAALYLNDGTNRYERVTEYGFRNDPRVMLDVNDPIVDRCGRGRTPFFINGLTAEPRFSEILFHAQTERLLAAPLYSRGKMVGLIDMRDKAAKASFEQTDVPKAQAIAERLVALFANKNVFGQRFITLSDQAEPSAAPGMTPSSGAAPLPQTVAQPAPAPAPAAFEAPPLAQTPLPRPAPAAPPPPPQPQPQQPAHVPRLATLIIDARAAADRIVVAPSPDTLTENDLAAAREVLRAILLIPGAATVSLSAFGHLGGVQEIAARSTLTDEAKNVLQSKLNIWLTKRGEAGSGVLRTNVTTPFGTSAPPIGAAQLQKVFTAPVVAGAFRGLYLTVAFATVPERAEHELLAALLNHLQATLEQTGQKLSLQSLRLRVAAKLVEPDFAKFPELRRHTDNVVKLTDALARFAGLTPAEAETARITAVVHDCGMRLLDYDRLYRKRD
ncbi:MAG TPA: GAF domain-containing protein, partial [Thermoanaerobaculia bacterium]